MASQITATLPALDFPKEVDYPTQEDWATFSAAAEENFGILGGGWSTQMQLWKDQANAMSTELNTNATIAQGLANYQGDWTSQAYTLGQTVSIGEVYYICKLTHSTGQSPTDVSSLYWNLALGNWSLKADKTEVALKLDKDFSAFTDKTTPIETDVFPIMETSGLIKKLSWANLKTTLKTYFDTLYVKLTPTIATGTATFTNATNNINLTGIGIGVENGDVIIISGSTNNNGEFTVEVITDANNIIVNQAHAGKSRTVAPIGTKALINETANITVKLLAKHYNAPSGLGQGDVDMTAQRTLGLDYTNPTNREIFIKVTVLGTTASTACSSRYTKNGIILNQIDLAGNSANAYGSIWVDGIQKNNTYKISNVVNAVKDSWIETR